MLNLYFEDYSKDIQTTLDKITLNLIKMLDKLKSTLLPTPTKSYYNFSYRDLSRIVLRLSSSNNNYIKE